MTTTTTIETATNETMSGREDAMGMLPGVRNRFYSLVLLLDGLRYVYRKDNSLSQPDLESGVGTSDRETYFCFLNKLSQICDSRPRQSQGGTVSAVTALDSGTIEYRLASNQRGAIELEEVRSYLTDILSILGQATDDQVADRDERAPIASTILQRILAFNRPRIKDYLQLLVHDPKLEEDRLDWCIRYAENGTAQGVAAARALRELQPYVDAARSALPLDSNEFARHAESLLQAIHRRYKNSLEAYMKGFSDPNSPWTELRHAVGRLYSYFLAVRVMFEARERWPRLFLDFEVTTVPSSTPLEPPPNAKRRARDIIGQMPLREFDVEELQAQVEPLQKHGLDEHLKRQSHSTRFRPIVHAEVLLLDSVLRSRAAADRDGDGPLRFFNEADFGGYIASSKPTCFLCHTYFTAHPARVKCRPSHYNHYINWKLPDLHPEDGPVALDKRKKIINEMVTKLRYEISNDIISHSSTRSRHDSRDTPTNPFESTALTESRIGDGGSMMLSAQFAGLALSRRPAISEDRMSSRREVERRDLDTASVMAVGDGSEVEVDDDEDGGARL